MPEVENPVLDILRCLQEDMTVLKQGQRSIREELISLRQQLHIMQGDGLRREQEVAGILVQLDRINTRLKLVGH